jgi:hypothetical protein
LRGACGRGNDICAEGAKELATAIRGLSQLRIINLRCVEGGKGSGNMRQQWWRLSRGLRLLQLRIT